MSQAPSVAEDIESARRLRRMFWAQVVALVAGIGFTIPAEVAKVRTASETKVGLLAWIFLTNLDTTFPLLLFVILPLAWFVRSRRQEDDLEIRPAKRLAASQPVNRTTSDTSRRIAWAMALACALTSLAGSAWIASNEITVEEKKPTVPFGDLPPAIHDEFSYLFQTKTFLAGKISFPSSPRMPELFDQMHVLNEGRFASRYFPGVGLWLAPFLAIGHPHWGEFLAGALTAFFIFWAARELAGNWVGLAAGLLTALSPGMGLFMNLLLSHGPTMAALAFFLFLFLRFMRTGRTSDVFWAGCGLSFAMLCRPLTAAGFGLPFGLWLLWRCAARMPLVKRFRSPMAPDSPTSRFPAGLPLRQVAALALPLVVGFVVLFVYDYAITGDGFLSPYSLYTRIYTPSHIYGFNNVEWGERHPGPKVIENYDHWAENLTPGLAVKNVGMRALATAQWTLGPVPLLMATIVFVLAALWPLDWRWRLVAASIVALHAAYFPYWLAGIQNWHYVFETGPLFVMIFAVTTQQLIQYWRSSQRKLMPIWWSALIVSAVVTNWLPFDPFWNSRLDRGIEELAFSRVKYERFQRYIHTAVTRRPALLLIEPDPSDRHIDFVYNDPDLSGPVIRGRYRSGKTDLAQVVADFPNRTIYLYSVKTARLRIVSRR
jgi:Dolichyl-phosphate-mannose-protein mannosyltransferase